MGKKKTKAEKPAFARLPSELECVVEVDGEIRSLSLQMHDNDDELRFSVYLSGDLDDSNETPEEILETYGKFYWKDLDDFAANRKGVNKLKEWLDQCSSTE